MEDILEQHGQQFQKLHIVAAGRISYPSMTPLGLPSAQTFDRRDFYESVARFCPNSSSHSAGRIGYVTR